MIDRASPFFVHFLVNEMQSFKEYSPMVFKVSEAFLPEVSDLSDSKTDIAYLVLDDPIYLDKGVEFVKLADNNHDRVYNNCTMVSVSRSNAKSSINLTCNFYFKDDFEDQLECHPVNNTDDLHQVFFDPGSPIFCEENSSIVQVGFVAKYPYLFPQFSSNNLLRIQPVGKFHSDN
ncbi:hypothetical protein KQX54_017641 [Cotesia glomerata]|uniref:Uncharacterized protein n=1 Tax=Cotesia glomerata TaxID=32391 RepID=A0AAV7IQW5_COTGL|nr:hypothetical protein KQX54_017641 [Cotesia glomerata]